MDMGSYAIHKYYPYNMHAKLALDKVDTLTNILSKKPDLLLKLEGAKANAKMWLELLNTKKRPSIFYEDLEKTVRQMRFQGHYKDIYRRRLKLQLTSII